MLPTYGPGGDRRRGGGGRCRGGGDFLWPELVVSDEAVGGQAEVGQELDQELVSVRQHRPANRGSLTAATRRTLSPQRNPLRQNHLRWGAVAAVFANPLGVVDFAAVEDGDVVVAAVVVPLHVELLELDFDNLEGARKTGKGITSTARRGLRGLTDSFITLSLLPVHQWHATDLGSDIGLFCR